MVFYLFPWSGTTSDPAAQDVGSSLPAGAPWLALMMLADAGCVGCHLNSPFPFLFYYNKGIKQIHALNWAFSNYLGAMWGSPHVGKGSCMGALGSSPSQWSPPLHPRTEDRYQHETDISMSMRCASQSTPVKLEPEVEGWGAVGWCEPGAKPWNLELCFWKTALDKQLWKRE